jgi:DNA-binding CsgD family transcriptional regulator
LLELICPEDNHAVVMPTVEDRRRFVRLLHRRLDLDAFFDAADRALAVAVPFDSACWLSLDPATLLPTSHFTREIGAAHVMALAANEYLEEDANKFAVLARAPLPVAVLSAATHGQFTQSPRYMSVLAPYGYADGDELRAVFLHDESAWGCVALHRRYGLFDDRDVRVVAELAGLIAEGIRRAILTTALGGAGDTDPPGLIVLGRNRSVESATATAQRWLAEMIDSTGTSAPVPLVIMTVADQARRAGAGTTEDVATARVPTRTGRWLLVHAFLLDGAQEGRVGVMLHPAAQPDVAQLIVEAYGLSKRERDVTRLVLRGLSTREIADALHVTPYTVQDHLKAIFDKMGVRSRRELVAQLFFRHYAPRMEARSPIGSDGWFTAGSGC